jgi:hypothetical protein
MKSFKQDGEITIIFYSSLRIDISKCSCTHEPWGDCLVGLHEKPGGCGACEFPF